MRQRTLFHNFVYGVCPLIGDGGVDLAQCPVVAIMALCWKGKDTLIGKQTGGGAAPGSLVFGIQLQYAGRVENAAFVVGPHEAPVWKTKIVFFVSVQNLVIVFQRLVDTDACNIYPCPANRCRYSKWGKCCAAIFQQYAPGVVKKPGKF